MQDCHDIIVVGAGFGGLYAAHRFTGDGWRVLGIEGADDVGGVWYHNRYPGARVDVDSIDYCYYFSPELYREWQWSERFATQPELLAYIRHVAKRFDLKRLYRFGTWLTAARWDSDAALWQVETSTSDRHSARFLVMATGNLSQARTPDFPGLADFRGEWVQTAHWPDRHVETEGKRIAVIGTGSSGVQTVPELAKVADRLYVFQRTPNFSVPARNGPPHKDRYAEIAADIPAARAGLMRSRAAINGISMSPQPAASHSPEMQQQMLAEQWDKGGHGMAFLFADQGTKQEVNDLVADFVRDRVRETVKDPITAEMLCPADHPIGSRRLCLDTGYYETFNRDNVTLVDVRADPIVEITPAGIRTESREWEVDLIVFALGFEAFRGVLDHADIRNEKGEKPTTAWSRGPRTYLGLMTAGFPNLFLLTGAGSPSVLANMVVANEQHVDFVAELLDHMRSRDLRSIDAAVGAQDEWTEHVAEVARPLLRNGVKNYMVHVNADGSRYFIPYTGGFDRYVRKCEEVAASGYPGFVFQ